MLLKGFHNLQYHSRVYMNKRGKINENVNTLWDYLSSFSHCLSVEIWQDACNELGWLDKNKNHSRLEKTNLLS
jgi:hypothetical protein